MWDLGGDTEGIEASICFSNHGLGFLCCHLQCEWEAAGDPAVLLVEGQNNSWIDGDPGQGRWRRGPGHGAVDLLQVVRPSSHLLVSCFQQGHERLPSLVCDQVASFR